MVYQPGLNDLLIGDPKICHDSATRVSFFLEDLPQGCSSTCYTSVWLSCLATMLRIPA